MTYTFFLLATGNVVAADLAAPVALQLPTVAVGILIGILATLAILAAALFLQIKDRRFLYFEYLLAAATVQLLNLDTALADSFWFVAGSACCAPLTAFYIGRQHLIDRHHRNTWRLMLGTGATTLLAIPLTRLDPQAAVTLAIAGNALVVALVGLASLLRLREGHRPSRYPLAGAVLFLIILASAAIPSAFAIGDALALALVTNFMVLGCGLGSTIDTLNRRLKREVAARSEREQHLLQAQRIALYGDWFWDTRQPQPKLSENIFSLLTGHVPSNRDFDALLERVVPDDRHALLRALLRSVRQKKRLEKTFRVLGADSALSYFLIQADFRRDSNGHPSEEMIGTLHDITDRRLAELARERDEQRWRELADATFEVILLYRDNIIIDVNRACEETLGYTARELIGSYGEAFIGVHDLQHFLEQIASQEGAFERRVICKDGKVINVELRSKIGSLLGQDINIVAIRDISQHKQDQEQLRLLGYYDSLTGLANRTLFQERLQHAIDKAQRGHQNHALLFIDLDQFKNVNDSLGHEVGDQLLIEVGRRLKNNTRSEDTVARLGGDEFAILIEDIPAPYAAAKVADQIIKTMFNTVEVDDYRLMVTPSIGIAIFPSDGDNMGELIRKADTAMYHAKNQGRNNYQFYTDQLNAKAIRRMSLESELRVALPNNELYLQYQPKVDLLSGHIVGAEALLRWDSEKHGIVSPAEFISVAEETGLIWPIGEFVLTEACTQAVKWLRIYPQFGAIAVNISGLQFNHSSLVETVEQVLAKTGVAPQHLELEITEGAIINNADEAIVIMRRLKEMGVKLSLDDFGTGYSSLNYLKRFPVDSLKIDRSFLAEIVSNKPDRRIAASIINLAHDLQLNVVAEGVETNEQLSIIHEMRCDELQGYIFSKPINAETMSFLLKESTNLYHLPAVAGHIVALERIR